VLVTSYGLLRSDVEALSAVDWRAAIFDEAQFDQERRTTPARAPASCARHAARPHGTPVENHLGELWAIMDLVNPKLLGSLRDFERRYEAPITPSATRSSAERAAQRCCGRSSCDAPSARC
jgi:SNF2 family DNA or RNA helicase